MEQTRRLFFVLALLSLLLTAPAAAQGGAWSIGLAAVSCSALGACWTHRYLSRTAAPALDVLEAVATAVFALACPMPAVAFSVTFPAMWFRAVYGRTWQVGAYVVAVCAGLVVATLAWGIVPGHAESTEAGAVFGTLPVVLLTLVGARHFATGLFAREQTRQRDAALSALGSGLLGVTDLSEIHRRTWQCVLDICRATPGLRALLVVDDDGNGPLRVAAQAGAFDREPAALPRDLLPAAAGPDGPSAVAVPGIVAEATGPSGEWLCLPLPAAPGQYVLLGAPGAFPAEALTAVTSMVNQVTLAVRSSRMRQDLEAQARTDVLTGLGNRAAFTAAVDDAVRAGDPSTWVLFVDLDDFKDVNDTLGHTAGDDLLRRLGSRMARALRPGDVCARLGGDEFGVLLRDASEDEAGQVCQRLVELLSAPVRLDGGPTQVGASVGMAALQSGASGAVTLQHADIAMYAAKAAGKNRVECFSPDLLGGGTAAAREAELRTAIAEEQFVVHYQPIVSTADGRCTAV